MKKTPIKRRKGLKTRSKLRKVSVKQKGRLARYYALREPFMKEHPICQICGISPSTDVHHRKSRRGNLLFDQAWWMALCRSCHSKRVHGDVDNAKKMGWLVPFWR